MVAVTVEFLTSGKTLHQMKTTKEDAIAFLLGLKGSHFIGYLDDGSFALYIGSLLTESD